MTGALLLPVQAWQGAKKAQGKAPKARATRGRGLKVKASMAFKATRAKAPEVYERRRAQYMGTGGGGGGAYGV